MNYLNLNKRYKFLLFSWRFKEGAKALFSWVFARQIPNGGFERGVPLRRRHQT